jgi:hypothetical protein
MTTRFVKDKARTETPRLKDLGQITARDPSVGRTAGGRFGAGNQAASGHGWKAQIRRMLGSDASDENVKQVLALYLALLRELPADGAGVRQLAAAQARHAWLATEYTNLARAAGVGTAEGMKYADAARTHDLAAQRLGVTAFDRAAKEATARAGARPRGNFEHLLALPEGKP